MLGRPFFQESSHPRQYFPVLLPDNSDIFFNLKNASKTTLWMSLYHPLINVKSLRILAPRISFTWNFRDNFNHWQTDRCQTLTEPRIHYSASAAMSLYGLETAEWPKYRHVFSGCKHNKTWATVICWQLKNLGLWTFRPREIPREAGADPYGFFSLVGASRRFAKIG